MKMKFQNKFLHLLVICSVLFCYSKLVESTELNGEISILLSIKSSFIDPLDQLKGWKLPDNATVGNSTVPCSWTGVQCNSNGTIEILDLSHMNLTGRVPDQIQGLKSLKSLNLCCNGFSSPLPKSLSNLTALESIDLSQNFFLDAFPMGLGMATKLLALNASGNNFSGYLPEDLANAASLESLDLRGNFFEGSIPRNYKNLVKLKYLGLSGNNLTGKIPTEIGQLSSLETIVLGYNGFEGEIPKEFGNLTNLKYLDLAIGNLGEIPAKIADLKKLQLLNVMSNRLSGSVPAGIADLSQLQVLELWNNTLSGPLPSDLGLNSPLQWLDISSNSFSGPIPTNLCSKGNLTKLILFNNAFSGPITASLSTCTSLVRVRMQNNNLSGSIPIGFGKLENLQRLEVANNSLTGQIPSDLSASTSLSFIDLSRNQLQSTLPSSILSIPNLQSFLVSGNNLIGKIPDQFQDCLALSLLDLSSNNFIGRIPSSIASCDRLVTLNLRNNQLNGTIPNSIAMMHSLSVLDLSNNSLTGGIPENFGNSPALETLNVSHNRLTGPVPSNGMLRTINPDDLIGNPGLCGSVLPPCSRNEVNASRKRDLHMKHIIGGWVIGISTVLALFMAGYGARSLYKRWRNGNCFEERIEMGNGEWPWRLMQFQRLGFNSNDILSSIKESNVIGMGATGTVYKAEIQKINTTVAVKKLWRSRTEIENGGGGDLVGEVNLLGRLRHRNIVRLLGFLHNDSDSMIIFEFMPNGSLGEALHGKQEGRLLVDWVSRYNIAVGVAQGLAYLHNDCHPPVIHRDVKSNNILLDANLEARIADFGLAKMMVQKNETVSMVAGSYGYIAPEYGYTLKVDEKSDIYSYGVVLMELLTGKRPLDPEFGESVDIVEWIQSVDIVEWIRKKMRENKPLEEALDPSVGNTKPVQEEMLLVLRIAILCTAKLPKDRPSMIDVLTMLGEAKPRRKSSSNISGNSANKETPLFSASPLNEL